MKIENSYGSEANRFILYGLGFASNLLIVAFAPLDLLNGFLSTYATASLFGGICIVLTLGSRKATSVAHFWVPIMLLCLCLVIWIWPIPGVWITYAFVLLMSDYLSSQSGSIRLPAIYRGMMIISSLPFIFYPNIFISLILLRIALCLTIIATVFVNNKKLQMLKIHSPLAVVSISNVAYFGSLLFMTVILSNDSMRAWYIGTQVGLGLLLKRFDFLIRGNTSSHSFIDKGILLFVIAIPFVLMMFWFNLMSLLAYSIGVFAISQLKYFVREQIKSK